MTGGAVNLAGFLVKAINGEGSLEVLQQLGHSGQVLKRGCRRWHRKIYKSKVS